MQSDHQTYRRKVPSTHSEQVGGGYIYNAPVAPTIGATAPPGAKHLKHFNGVRLQPSEVCPKNFIIFDQSDNGNRIMFHPALTTKFNHPIFDAHATFVQDYGEQKDIDTENKETSSSLKENMEDIDVLLSLDEVEQEDEEEVSTARTNGSCGSSSPDSCSSYSSRPNKMRLSSSPIRNLHSSCGSSNSERQQQRVKKMVKTLRGIVPGADQMNTAAVLDEAVKYLKSLKMEVKKLGIQSSNN